MATNNNLLEELNLNDISAELVRKEILKVVKKQLNSDNVKLYTQHGSKKGRKNKKMFINFRGHSTHALIISKNKVTTSLVPYTELFIKMRKTTIKILRTITL